MDLKYQFEFIQAIRNFFLSQDFTDVMTPPLVQNPGMETHIHPYQVRSAHKQENLSLYLHTSPEFKMKEILSTSALQNIFTLTYSFRDEPQSPIHRNQFIMLEWYRKEFHYEKIMEDMEDLTQNLSAQFSSQTIDQFPRMTVDKLFQEILNISILDYLDRDELIKKITLDFKNVPLPSQTCSWDDYFFLLFLNSIEPHLKSYPYLLLYEFPAPLAALSTLQESDPRVCERFEVYMNGIEICNCFNELIDFNEQQNRFNLQAEEKKILYSYELPPPIEFYDVLKKGLPQSSGIALGVERLLMALTNEKQPFFN